MLSVGLSKMRVTVGVYIEGTNLHNAHLLEECHVLFPGGPKGLGSFGGLCSWRLASRGDLLFTESWRVCYMRSKDSDTLLNLNI